MAGERGLYAQAPEARAARVVVALRAPDRVAEDPHRLSELVFEALRTPSDFMPLLGVREAGEHRVGDRVPADLHAGGVQVAHHAPVHEPLGARPRRLPVAERLPQVLQELLRTPAR